MSNNNPTRSVLINPIIARSKDELHRAATPLELLYDLVYVVAIALLAAELHHALTEWHHVPHAILMYLWIFWCVWWPWNTYTFFASGYDTDDTQFRIASFVQMLGVIVVAIGIKPAFQDENFLYIMLGYVVMRIPYIIMWLKVARDDIDSRPVALRYAMGVFAVQCGWTLTVLFYQSWPVWILLLVCELLVPWFAERSTAKGENTKYHVDHIEERMGLLTLIALAFYLIAAWLCHDFILKKKGPELLELLVLAVVVILLAVTTQSVLLIGFAFATLNIIRLSRMHREFKQQRSAAV